VGRRLARRRREASSSVPDLVAQHLDAGRPTGWFEPVYRAARRDERRLPWTHAGPHPYLTDWLRDPVAAPPGPRAVVVGCGLGDDAAELARHGFEVTAFDVAPSAVAWAQRRHTEPVTWRVADLLALPDDLVGAFDLVVELMTVPWLPGVVREAAMQAIGRLAAPRGVVLAVTLVGTSEAASRVRSGPPWVQAPSELPAYLASGLLRLALEHPDADGTGAMEVRLTFQRPATVEDPPGELPLIG
jgi:SAM-dependent methyltransferase